MPTIVQAVKSEDNVLVSCKDCRLAWDKKSKEYFVVKYGRTSTKILCSTKDQKIAVDFLLGKR